MRLLVQSKRAQGAKESTTKKRRKGNSTDHDSNDNDGTDPEEEGNHQTYLRGGLLQPGELKALASGVHGIDKFRELGSTSSSLEPKIISALQDEGEAKESEINVHTTEEKTRLEKNAQEKLVIERQLEALKDRERFVDLVKARGKALAEELKKKDKSIKDICGFDSRLSWSDEQFESWRTSTEGRECLSTGILSENGPIKGETDGEGDVKMAHGDGVQLDADRTSPCQKKRCERHRTWAKLQSQEIGFETDQCVQKLKKLDKETRTITEKAKWRNLEGGEALKAEQAEAIM